MKNKRTARIELVKHQSLTPEVGPDGAVTWIPDESNPPRKVYLLFWSCGRPWIEVNLWALSMAKLGLDSETTFRAMKHLLKYARWLEANSVDWREFPTDRSERCVFRYRAHLMELRKLKILAPSTVAEAMNAVKRAYQHFVDNSAIKAGVVLWNEKTVAIHHDGNDGFSRTSFVQKSDLSLSSAKAPGVKLEGNCTPLRQADADALLAYTNQYETVELHLMLLLGFSTGARYETIVTIGITNLINATLSFSSENYYEIDVGPGTGIAMKNDVSGKLLIPNFLYDALMAYSHLTKRLFRQALAKPENRGFLFLTSKGNRYVSNTFTKLISDLRVRCKQRGMKFMNSFKFHNSRATFGTSVLSCALEQTTVPKALTFLKGLMHHADAVTTPGYIEFIEHHNLKIDLSNKYTEQFTGLVNRDWTKFEP